MKILVLILLFTCISACGSDSKEQENHSIYGLWKNMVSARSADFIYVEKDKLTLFGNDHFGSCAYASESKVKFNEAKSQLSRYSIYNDGWTDVDYEINGDQLTIYGSQYESTTFENSGVNWCYDHGLQGTLRVELEFAPNFDAHANLMAINLDVSIYIDMNRNDLHDYGDFHIRLFGSDMNSLQATAYMYFGDGHRARLYEPVNMLDGQTLSVEIPKYSHFLFDQLSSGVPVRIETLNGDNGCQDTIPNKIGYLETPLIQYMDQEDDVGFAYGSVKCPNEKPMLDLVKATVVVSKE